MYFKSTPVQLVLSMTQSVYGNERNYTEGMDDQKQERLFYVILILKELREGS